MKTKIISFVLSMLIFTGCFSVYSIAFGDSPAVFDASDSGVISDNEQALKKLELNATEVSVFNFDNNPLINLDKTINEYVLPSFNIDETGFVRSGTKLQNLMGKTLVFYTGEDFAAWSYRNAKGETIDEWKWFEKLRDEIGLSVKYTVTSRKIAGMKSFQDMTAGKQCDIIYSTQFSYPASLAISRSMTDLISINDIGSSPGVCKTTMDICKWGDTLRVIAPIGVVDVLWYNATLAQEFGLSDPHTMWEADKWDWNAYSNFLKSVPQKTRDGKDLTAMVHWNYSNSYIWPLTTGTPHISIYADASAPTIINNWEAPSTIRAWEFATGVHNTVNYAGPASEDSPGNQKEYNGLYEGTTLMAGTMYPQIYRDTEYSKHVRINWVPYPMEKTRTLSQMQEVINNKYSGSEVKPAASHDGIAQTLGYGMLLPKTTVKEDNVNAALKFMELWATRFTESFFDNLGVYEYYGFNYLQKKQYFDFVTQNVALGLPMNNFSGSEISTNSNFFDCFSGEPTYNVRTEATKISDMVYSCILDNFHNPEKHLCAHDFEEYVYNNDATYEKDGTKTATCSACGETDTVTAEGTKLYQNGWIKEGGKWYYYEKGTMLKKTWMKDSVGWCYLGEDGTMKTNCWVEDSKGWCFLNAYGYCVTNTWKKDSIGWFYLDSEGAMVKNDWVYSGGKWYYLDENGYRLLNAWHQDSKGWCYLGSDGAMVTNKWIMDSVGWCYVGADGYCVTNQWMADSIGWCYLDAEGRMVVNGWIRDSYGLCWLDESGYWDGIYY